MWKRLVITVALLLVAFSARAADRAADRADRLIADFESETYGDWQVEGDAFGTGPARGTLPGQMHVEGYEGERLVNSFIGGDNSTGSLTSPPFKIERKYINFLIGGGGYDETAIELLVDGKSVRKASGPNTVSGGSERLDWKTWDVADFAEKSAMIRIVDHRTGGWGHINVDQIVQSDRKRQAEPASRDVQITKRYLHLPVKNGAQKRRMNYVVDGKTVREFEIELADAQPDFFVFSDVSPFIGKALKIEAESLPADSKALDAIVASDELPHQEQLYAEALRPQFHFTSRRGWLNDPNGLVVFDEEWHLFYQHNPYGAQWGNMHWGHAVSRDLVNWQELPIALYPKEFGDWAFSGSAVVDEKNTSGFRKGDKPPLVLAFTSTGRGECIAYSNDRGRSWTEYDGNPVIRHRGRDPKLIPSPAGTGWNMVVYDEGDNRQSIDIYSSPDLKSWKFESRINGFFECPDFFALPIDANVDRLVGRLLWVMYAADGEYMLGGFDGKTFKPLGGKQKLWYGNFYAAQTFDHAPKGRRIQIGWGRGIEFAAMPFNQQMTVPVELTLHDTDAGPRMFAIPVRELERLRGERHEWNNLTVGPSGEQSLEGIDGDTFDIEATIDPGDAQSVSLSIRGVPLTFDVKKGTLICRETAAPVKVRQNALRLRVLVDRASIEVFANDGETAMSIAAIPPAGQRGLSLIAKGGTATYRSLVVYDMKSSWRE
jgi:fructan beta-fructosidase